MQRTNATFLSELAMYMALLLMARCGMRISEPLHLMKHHYRREEGTIYIEKTKFRKDRLIPLPKTVIQEMENYLSVRASPLPRGSESIPPSRQRPQNPIPDQQVRFLFHDAVREIGISQPRKKLGNIIFNPPVPHCLRHSFAVNTLKAIKERGQSPQHALPVLATYLGHATYFNTSVYLKVADASSRNKLSTIFQSGKKVNYEAIPRHPPVL
jgi:integrase/recombinase XerD